MEIGDYFGQEVKTPLQEQDGQTDKAGRWWKVVASERQSWVSFGKNGSGFGVASWVMKAGEGQSEVLKRSVQGGTKSLKKLCLVEAEFSAQLGSGLGRAHEEKPSTL